MNEDARAALQTLEEAAPTFKQIKISLKLNIGDRKVACHLYQFDHGQHRQAWLAGEDHGDLRISDAIATFGRLFPCARVDETSLRAKSVKGQKAPALKPKELQRTVLSAFLEVLPAPTPSPTISPIPSFQSTAFEHEEGLARWLPLMGRAVDDEALRRLLGDHGISEPPKVPRGSCSAPVKLEDCGLIFESGNEFPFQEEHSTPEMLILKAGSMNPLKQPQALPYRLSPQDTQREVREKLGAPDREDDFMPWDEWDLEGRVLRVDYDDDDDNRISYVSFFMPPVKPLTESGA